jgi:hypothetical protein
MRLRHIVASLAFTAAHIAATFVCLFFGSEAIMASFDGKGSETLAMVAALALAGFLFPMNVLSNFIPRGWVVGTVREYILLVANSALCGVAATVVWSWWRTGRRRAGGADAAGPTDGKPAAVVPIRG